MVVRSIIALALISGLYYEAISSSSNLQAKAFHAVENSKAGLSIMNTTTANSGTSTGLAGMIADAEFKLESCKRKVAEGRYKDCNNSEAKLRSLKDQAQAERDSAASASVQAIGAKQAALDKERDSHALPAAKYAAQLVNMSNDAGTMIVVIIAALLFELIHVTTIFNEARALRGIDDQTAMVKRLSGDYFKETGKTFDDGDFMDNRKIDLSENPLTFTPPAPSHRVGPTASTSPLFKYQHQPEPEQPGRRPVGFAPWPGSQNGKSASKLGTAEKQLELPESSTWNAELSQHGIHCPADEVLNQAADKAQIERIIAAGRNAVTRPTPTTTPNYLKGSETTPAGTTTPDYLKGSEQGGFDHLYPLWIAGVVDGSLKASEGAFSGFVNSHIDSRARGLNKARLAEIWDSFGQRGVGEGRLQINPHYQPGNRKTKYLLA